MKPLFLNPPTFEDFDGGAGARYQASREVTSFWYPTWLCYPAGMIEGSLVVDAPVQKLNLEDCLRIAEDFDMVVMYTSTPTLKIDSETARRIKEQKPVHRDGPDRTACDDPSGRVPARCRRRR